VENMSRAIGLTKRKSRNWRMAREITERLQMLDPEDPVKYDFALCHKRMSGDCLDRRDPVVCSPCGLRAVCRHWNVGGGLGGPLRSLPQRLRGQSPRPSKRRDRRL